MPSKQTGFIGFPDGKWKPVKVPDFFFTDLLPQIDDLAELKLTLHALFLLNNQNEEMRYLRGDDLRSDSTLLAGLNLDSELRTPLAALGDALERAVARNSLIRLDVEVRTLAGHAVWEDWYFLNTVKGRQAAALIRQGNVAGIAAIVADDVRLRVERPNVFVLYEQNIGLMTPLIADQLRDMEKSYPPEWVAEAFDIAVGANKRALRYILAILKRWETEGKTDGEKSERDSLEERRRKYGNNETEDSENDVPIG
jgi:DnaD/phage-associated family protein